MSDDFSEFTPHSCCNDKSKKTIINQSLIKVLFSIGGIMFLLLLVGYLYISKLNKPAIYFPIDDPIEIEEGMNVREITELLKNEGVVKSDVLLYYILLFLYEPTDIKASTYVFDKPLTTREVALRLTQGDFNTNLIRFTHFEGERVSILAIRAAEKLSKFDVAEFISLAEPLEGRMFPETYFIPNDYTSEDLYELMLETFNKKIEKLDIDNSDTTLNLDEILILASIIEREANTKESKKMVAGILLNRLAINMPLQADASIEYVLDKPLSELTPEDLKIDSPYNTYLNLGLPPTPIGNPGLDAIQAVLEPIASDYYFYITGDDGEFYYAETYEQHLRNISYYLR